jgi:hypothetical protein
MDNRNILGPREEPLHTTSHPMGGLDIEEASTSENQHPLNRNENSSTSSPALCRSILETRNCLSYTDRLSTFTNWPQQIVQRPGELSSAGFYYTGVGDRVRCGFCEGELYQWEVTDIPFQEHLRWFPDCLFIKEYFQEVDLYILIVL